MFWSEHGSPSRIWSANMDLSDKRPLQTPSNTSVVNPVSLIVKSDLICWVNSGQHSDPIASVVCMNMTSLAVTSHPQPTGVGNPSRVS